MKALIYKDFLLSRKTLWLAIIFVLFWGTVGPLIQNNIIGGIIYIYLVFFLSYYCGIVIFGYDEKAKSDVLINSLPVNRKNVVISRYIFLLWYPIMLSLIIYGYSRFINTTFLREISQGRVFSSLEVLFTIIVVTLFMSIYLPFTYLSIGKVKAFNQIFYLVLLFLPWVATQLLRTQISKDVITKLQSINTMGIGVGVFISTITIYIISLFISIRLYERKDF